MHGIAENLRIVKERIRMACERVGRQPESVRLVAVSKTKPPELIEEAWRAGQRLFGENYVQEMLAKVEALKHLDGIEWHFVGRLQRNKVKHLPGRVALIQSVDSVKLVEEIEKRACDAGKLVEVLVEVNLGGEETKGGTESERVSTVVEAIETCRWVKCKGLMAIPPLEEDPEQSRKWFRKLRAVRDELGGEKRLPILSMGMSTDFEVAIEEGATIVRVGTAIFGERG